MGKFLCKSHKDAAKVVKIIEIYKNFNEKIFFFLKKWLSVIGYWLLAIG